MARCKDCIHYEVCAREGRLVQIDEHTWDDYNQLDNAEVFCNNYLSTDDVAPKSEVERLKTEVKVLTENNITAKYPCCVSCSKGLILTKSLKEYDKLLADIANEVAREIFEEIEKIIQSAYYVDELGEWHDETLLLGGIDELKKKYAEEDNE